MIQQKTLLPQKHTEELVFLKHVIDLLAQGKAIAAKTFLVARHDTLLAESEPALVDYNPQTAHLPMQGAAA
jgi:hypothetical protein